jgi:hypothetical protein
MTSSRSPRKPRDFPLAPPACSSNSLPPDAEIAPDWDAFLAALGRPAPLARIRTLFERGFHEPGDVEMRLGYHVGQLGFTEEMARPRGWCITSGNLSF